MTVEQDDVLDAIEEHTKAVDSSLGGVKTQIIELQKQLAKEGEEREALEKKVNRFRMQGASKADEDTDGQQRFEHAVKTLLPGHADRLRNLDYAQYKSAFDRYLRYGLNSLEPEHMKTLSVGVDTDGGYLAPAEFSTELIRVERANSVMRQVARVLTMGAGSIKIPSTLTKFACGWVGETQQRDTTNTGTVGTKNFDAKELYAMPEATQQIIEDSPFNIENFITEEIGLSFAEEEDGQFIGGDGVLKPRGFTTYPIATTSDAAGTRPTDTIQYIATGQAGAWPATDVAIYDKLVDLVYSLRPRYRRRAVWLMGTEAIAKLRKMKDGQNNPIWQPSIVEGEPDRLLGYPVREAEQMPTIGANSLSVAFADWQRAYWIFDRIGVTFLRDPYTNKGFVRFYTKKRVAGGVADASAIKLLRFAAS